MTNNPNATRKEIEREDAASKAEDTLALYESAKGDMVTFLRTLQRGDGLGDLECLTQDMLSLIERRIFGAMPACAVPDGSATAILESLSDGSYEGAEEAIDDHFAAYIWQAMAIVAGEV